MIYIVEIIIVLIGICLYYFCKVKEKNKLNEVNKTSLINIKHLNDKLEIKIEELPLEMIENSKSMFEIKDNKLLTHINNLIPNLIQVGTTTNNAVQAHANVVYQAIIPAGTTLADSNNIKGAVRGFYRGSEGIKGHADFIEINQTGKVVSNTISSSIGVASMIVGQYYMTQINFELSNLNKEIAKINSFQNNEYKSKILALIVQVKRISTFQMEIMENQQLRKMDIDKLNQLEQNCIELLGQANLTITGFTKENNIDYKKYNEELEEIHNWYMYQKTLLNILYKIMDLKNILYNGTISNEQLNIIPETYTKQVMEVNKLLKQWHESITKKLEIDVETARRKRTGVDGVVHWIPGLFNNDFNFSVIPDKTKAMIEEQTANYSSISQKENKLFNNDVKIISKDGKVYYLPD